MTALIALAARFRATTFAAARAAVAGFAAVLALLHRMALPLRGLYLSLRLVLLLLRARRLMLGARLLLLRQTHHVALRRIVR